MSYFNASILTALIQASLMLSMLIRNIIFARLLSPEDFGLAMTFGVVLLFFEYVSNFGHENLMQRSLHGGRYAFQATVHGSLLIRGIIVSTIIVVSGPLISSLLNIPEGRFNYALLSVVPMINAFVHTDHQRIHRQHDYSLTARISILADISSIIIALIVVQIWSSYWAFYISFIFRHSVSTLFSHFWSIRPYLIRFKKKYALEIWQFGLPILFIGLLKYLGGESDKALVTRYIGLEELSSYFLAIMVVVGVTNFVSVGFSKIFIRRISVRNDSDHQTIAAFENGIILLYLVLPLLLCLGIMGQWLIVFLFGKHFQLLPYLIPIVCMLVCFRTINLWLYQLVIATDKTIKILFADITKLIGFAIAFFWLNNNPDIRLIPVSFALGELFYFGVLTFQLNTNRKGFWVIALKLLMVAISFLCALFVLYSLTLAWSFYSKTIIVFFCVLIILFAFMSVSKVCLQQTLIFKREFKKILNRVI